MASGKTVAGARLAARLGWRHIDLDQLIVERAGATIGEIFAASGEAAFREWETRMTDEVMAAKHVVLTPGGGWVTNAGVFDKLPEDTRSIWLRVSPEEVLRRLEGAAGQPVRPMLGEVDRYERIRELLERRVPLYQQAQVTIDTDGRSIDEVVGLIEAAMTRRDRPTSTQARENDH
jgi:shikimate kinase